MNQKYILWKAKIQQTIPHEKRFFKKLKQLFAKQEKEVLRNARKVSLSGAIKKHLILFDESVEDNKLKKEIEKQVDIGFKANEIDVILDQINFDKDLWDKEFIEQTEPLYRAMAQQAGQSILSDFGIDIRFNVDDREFRDYIRNRTIRFSGLVNGETQEGLNRAIKPILERARTIEEARKKIQEAIKKRYDSSVRGTANRARMIARTEMIGTSNGASLEGMRQSKGQIKYKAWLSSRDGKRVRQTHQKADRDYTRNRGIEVNKLFRVGTSKLSAPSNLISGDVGEVVNCRCIVTGARKGGARSGGLIPGTKKSKK